SRSSVALLSFGKVARHVLQPVQDSVPRRPGARRRRSCRAALGSTDQSALPVQGRGKAPLRDGAEDEDGYDGRRPGRGDDMTQSMDVSWEVKSVTKDGKAKVAQ